VESVESVEREEGTFEGPRPKGYFPTITEEKAQ